MLLAAPYRRSVEVPSTATGNNKKERTQAGVDKHKGGDINKDFYAFQILATAAEPERGK